VQKVSDENKSGRYFESRVSESWTDVPLAFAGKGLTHFPSDADRVLESAAVRPVTPIDLQSLSLKDPGLYRVLLNQRGEPYPMRPVLVRLETKPQPAK
jgi:hypothetical protein